MGTSLLGSLSRRPNGKGCGDFWAKRGAARGHWRHHRLPAGEAGTWGQPPSPLMVGRLTRECFFPMATEHGEKLERGFQAEVLPGECFSNGFNDRLKPNPRNHSLFSSPCPPPWGGSLVQLGLWPGNVK